MFGQENIGTAAPRAKETVQQVIIVKAQMFFQPRDTFKLPFTIASIAVIVHCSQL